MYACKNTLLFEPRSHHCELAGSCRDVWKRRDGSRVFASFIRILQGLPFRVGLSNINATNQIEVPYFSSLVCELENEEIEKWWVFLSAWKWSARAYYGATIYVCIRDLSMKLIIVKVFVRLSLANTQLRISSQWVCPLDLFPKLPSWFEFLVERANKLCVYGPFIFLPSIIDFRNCEGLEMVGGSGKKKKYLGKNGKTMCWNSNKNWNSYKITYSVKGCQNLQRWYTYT